MSKVFTIFGPPGTGKSTEILKRMKEKIDSGIRPSKIGLVSFTRAAAKELAERAGVQTGDNISTIHSMAYRMAGISKNSVVNWRVYKEFGKLVGIPIAGANPDDSDYLELGDEYLAVYSLAKARLQTYEETYLESTRSGTLDEFKFFAESFDKYKKDIGYIDFNDMLIRAADAPAPMVDVLFVDEAQDLSPLQWKLINHWAKSIPEIHVAGDDDQAIYVWGGADPQGMVKFETEHAGSRLILDQSHRVPKSVHPIASELIARVSSRVDKAYKHKDLEGRVSFVNNINHLEINPDEDTLILFRNHSIRKELEEMLVQRLIPFVVDTGKPGLLGSPKAKAIQVFIDIKAKTDTDLSRLSDANLTLLQKNLNFRAKAVFERNDLAAFQAFEWHEAFFLKISEREYFEAMLNRFGTLDIEDPPIHLSTIHGSKGREAHRVILLNGMGGLTAANFAHDPDSEYRTFYVGLTRSKAELDIVQTDRGIQIDFEGMRSV